MYLFLLRDKNGSFLYFDHMISFIKLPFIRKKVETNIYSELLFKPKYANGKFISFDSVWNEIWHLFLIVHLLYFLMGFISLFQVWCPVVHAEQQIYRNISNIVLKESIWNTVTFYFQNWVNY